MTNKFAQKFKYFRLKGITNPILLLSLLFVSVSCTPFQSNLNSLGETYKYNDVNIPRDFFYTRENGRVHIRTLPQEFLRSDPQISTAFKVDDKLYKLSHNNALRWRGCYVHQKAMGGYESSRHCGPSFFHRAFLDNLNASFFQCIHDAAETAKYPTPVKVFIGHVGSYANRRVRGGRSLSLHARARAIDIVHFTLFDKDGVGHRISTYKRDYHGSQAVFYDEFRDCWRESMPPSCTRRRSEYLGSIGHRDSRLGGDDRHNDHLHLSFPMCAGA